MSELQRVMLLGGPFDGKFQVVDKNDGLFVYYEMEQPSFDAKPASFLPAPNRRCYIRTTSRTMLHEDESQ